MSLIRHKLYSHLQSNEKHSYKHNTSTVSILLVTIYYYQVHDTVCKPATETTTTTTTTTFQNCSRLVRLTNASTYCRLMAYKNKTLTSLKFYCIFTSGAGPR